VLLWYKLAAIARPWLLAGCAAGCAIAPLAARASDDPCTTVATADVAAALGVPVTRTRRRVLGTQGASCSFRTGRLTTNAVVTALRFGSTSEASSTFRDMIAQNAQMQGVKATALHGIGDDAAVISTMVYTRKGSAIYTFSIADGPRTAAAVPHTEQLARATLGHVTP
jgi:hypothetical protein